MSETKHTPGPWTHNLDDGGFTIFGSDGSHICWRATPFANIDRMRILADVELLTSAPETARERDALRAKFAKVKAQRDALLAKLGDVMRNLGCPEKRCAAIDACGPGECERCLWRDLHEAVAAANEEARQ